MEDVPKESETIAVVRSARLAEKESLTRSGLFANRAWWSNTFLEILAVLAIFLLNLYLVIPFFGTAAPEVSFSGPIVPLLAKIIEYFGTPLGYSLQIINIIFFLIFPFTLYLFIKKVTGRKLAALLAVLIVSLPIYPFGEIRAKSAFFGIESSHMATIAFIPLALWSLLSYFREGNTKNLIIASMASGLVALISPFGFMTYLVMAGVTTFSEVLLGSGRLKMVRLITVLFFAGALNSFWYNPVFFYWMLTGPMGEEIRQTLSKLIPISLFAVPVLWSFGFLFFDRRPNLQAFFMASFFTIGFATIVLAGGGFFPEHPNRYAAEFGVSLAFLAAVLLVRLNDQLKIGSFSRIPKPRGKLVANVLISILIIFSFGTIILGKSNLTENQDVLGIWTGVEKGKIWIEKDKFTTGSLFGYIITAGALITLTGLSLRIKNAEK